MTEKFDDYQVGRGRPPMHTRFRKGQSGNPAGRRKQQPKATISLGEILAEAQEVQIHGRRAIMTKGEVLFRKQFERAVQGEPRAMKMIFDFMVRSGMLDTSSALAFEFDGIKDELARKLSVALDCQLPAPGDDHEG